MRRTVPLASRADAITEFLATLSQGSRTALGFFWKAGWAFVLGYFISGMIQAFVPRSRLTRHMGDASAGSVTLATLFGAASSSCSFAALSAARALVQKGAHFIPAVAFMFASTNLVLELGILIFIFLGWQFVAAEVVGGILLIAVSTTLMRFTLPSEWMDEARDKVEREGGTMDDDFDWKERITSRRGWRRVGQRFVGEWAMVWEEIVIGFTVAGFVAVLVPDSVWSALFLLDFQDTLPAWLIALENAVVGPLVAAATFIGSMGNIPLATVLNANGVLFAGIMAFIYSDLMVPPLVSINIGYYGRRVALYIAGIMFVSIIVTALALAGGFTALDIVPEGGRAVGEVTRFEVDYTFWLNCVMVVLAGWLVWLAHRFTPEDQGGHDHDHDDGVSVKRGAAITASVIVVAGAILTLTGI